ncbi:MAG: dephospho-CoA kinase [Pseudomonadota bacterium]
MLVVGLTGGIASGKSTVAELFAQLGAPVIDTDLIARKLVQPGQAALDEIVAKFGTQALQQDGQLNRAWLRQRIFSSSADRIALNAIMHPKIRAQVGDELAALQTASADYAIVVIPLLVESRHYDALLQRVLVVDASEEEQVQRLMQRDGQSRLQAETAIKAQASRTQRLQRADDVIDNHGAVEALARKVADLDRSYRQLASSA